MDQQIITEARRMAGKHGIDPTAWQLREIVRDARGYMSEGREWRVAVEYATTIMLRLYAVEDAPWSRA
jgi:hypothetical protein